MLDEYTNKYAFYFPETIISFKQLDFQASKAPIEVRLQGENIIDLKLQAKKIETYLRNLNEYLWVAQALKRPYRVQKLILMP
ncbi:MAG: hypothetical protein GX876_07470 [Bacteroidales bacterium]|nr:hypothetical protein [Bacteroidales bacterium]